MKGTQYKLAVSTDMSTAIRRPHNTFKQTRICVPDKGITLWMHCNEIIVQSNNDIPKDACDVVEVVVPDELIEAGLAYLRCRDTLYTMRDVVHRLIAG